MKTKDCFKYKNISYRDDDLDTFLPEEQKDLELGSVKSFPMGMTFLEACEKYAGTKDEKELLKYAFTLVHIESMLEQPERYELKTDGYSNLFLVENNEGGVSVVSARQLDVQWLVRVDRLGDDDEWLGGGHFFFRNLTLENSDTLTLAQAIEICKKAGLLVFESK